MDRWEQEALRSANDGMREQVDQMLDLLVEQRQQLAAVQQQLETARCSASSADGLVEVTVDATGVLVDVQFSTDALRSTADQLGKSVTDAGRAAAQRAQQQMQQMIAPIAEAIPDLPDLFPRAPSLRDPLERESHHA
ncbi:YbaB/EbfC family nucleoid-associated protein [Nocardia sp. NBC_00508]|uniref:YbaB/EbfC family nucleoid-associated protein n=1 Tax=Nocardia sp. NBC_00508 TaxID=2975992 RepID=UPI002E814AEB|nr:YbaB/EbfC family nucleoid-associated protein [Nocardia sp. NBC_00508]WUD67053.1 YbaB/EbfC family nucleoid-associated protein [Nocardia sp. NBC_00508]